MVLEDPFDSGFKGRPAIVALGATYVLIAGLWAVWQVTEGTLYRNVLIITFLIAGPGFILVLGGYQLPRTDVRSEFYTDVTARSFGGLGLMFGLLLFYSVQPNVSLIDSFQVVLILTGISAAAGFGLGIFDAKAKTRRLEVEESNERLEQFAYAASHDMQEPLRMISSYLQLLERQYGDDLDEEGKEFIEFAVDGAERMQQMIEGLLAYSRVDTQQAPLETVDLTDVVSDVRKNLEVQIAESDAEIEVEKLPRVKGNEDQLRQVFQNLMSNAITYSGDEPPKIHIFAERNSAQWIISVRDRGIGIARAEQEDIFDVFTRLQTGRNHDGSGIGLALCQRIVERHDGDIWVDSEVGEGSTFSFTLPAADDR